MISNQPVVIWLTGLPSAGKTTLALGLERRLLENSIDCKILDGDELRAGVNSGLGFSRDDRREAVKRAAELAMSCVDNGTVAIVAMVSPFLEDRMDARNIIGESRFVKIWVDTPLADCIERDPKGLYKRALSGDLSLMTGLGQEYQNPFTPSLVVDGRDPVEENVNKILDLLTSRDSTPSN